MSNTSLYGKRLCNTCPSFAGSVEKELFFEKMALAMSKAINPCPLSVALEWNTRRRAMASPKHPVDRMTPLGQAFRLPVKMASTADSWSLAQLLLQ